MNVSEKKYFKVMRWLVALTPFFGAVAIMMAYGVSIIGARHFPEKMDELLSESPHNFYIAHIGFNLFVGMVLVFAKKWRHSVFNGLLNFDWRVWLGFAFYVLINTNLFEIVILRRVAFGASVLPLIILSMYCFLKMNKENYQDKMAAGSLVLMATIIIVPGFYIPPFFNGIAGWTSGYNSASPLSYTGFQLVRDDGEEIWYSSAFFSPVTQIGRFRVAMTRTTKKTPEKKFKFVFENYRRVFPYIEKGIYPHQKVFGKYAYPTHTLTSYDPKYLEFPPERIAKIRITSVIKDRQTAELIEQTVLEEYDVQSGSYSSQEQKVVPGMGETAI